MKWVTGVCVRAWRRVHHAGRQARCDAVTIWLACSHPRTPWYAKVVGLFAVVYVFSPIDLIPDFFPLLGHLDDVLIAPLLITLTFLLLPDWIRRDCHQRAREWQALHGSFPQLRWGSALAVVIWVTLSVCLWVWLVPARAPIRT